MKNQPLKIISLVLCFLITAGSDYLLSQNVSDRSIEWLELEKAQELARENSGHVFIFTEAEWCSFCKKMKREIFPVEEVQDLLEANYYPVKIDIESDERLVFNGEQMTQRQFSRSMRISATPTMIFLNGSGDVMGVQPGYLPERTFKALLEYVVSDRYGRVDFEQYLEEYPEN